MTNRLDHQSTSALHRLLGGSILFVGITLLGGCMTNHESDQLAPVLSSVVPVIAKPIAKLTGGLRLRNGHLTGRQDIRSVLQRNLRPFDVVFLSAPYKATSLFIPGRFSHVGIWLGDMDGWQAVTIAPRIRSALLDGKGFFHADRDGVRFSYLDELLDADYVTVARLPMNVRREDVAEIMNSISTRKYDFNFNGKDNSELLCTELVLEFFGIEPVTKTRILGRSFVTPDQLIKALRINGAHLSML